MKIVHVSTNDLQGGAARSAYRLHAGLRKIGEDSSILVSSRSSDDPAVTTLNLSSSLLRRAWRRWRRMSIGRAFRRYQHSRGSGYELFTDDRSHCGSALVKQLPDCDVVNLHWVAGLLDYGAFFSQIAPTRKVVWTFHDMNAFTGGCHYDLGCGAFTRHCQACPQLGSQDPSDLSHQIWQRKQRIFSRLPASCLHIVTPSRWLADEAKRSALLQRFPVSVIPYGLDLDEFAPRNPQAIRELLGIPPEARVVLFVAEGLNNRRKGFGLLVESLNQCAGRLSNLWLLSLGQNKPQVPLQVPWLHVGQLNNDRFLSMIYSAADLFVICSVQDNLPNTVLEAIACGVPVVGVGVGGIPDMVHQEVTGLTVPPGDARALAQAILELLEGSSRREKMKAACRRVAVQEYSLEKQARRYVELYKTLLGQVAERQN